MPLLLHRSILPNYHLDGKDPIESAMSQMITKWSTRMVMWNGPSTSTMLNLQSSPPLTFRSQCLTPKHHTFLLRNYQQVLPIAQRRPAPRQPLLPKTPCRRLLSPPPAAAPANQQPESATPAENAMPPPATARANQQPESAPLCRQTPRLNPMPGHAHAIKSLPVTPPHHSSKNSRMACTFPRTVSFNECLGSKANPLSFANLRLVDLRNGHGQYLSTIKQLVDALPKLWAPHPALPSKDTSLAPNKNVFNSL